MNENESNLPPETHPATFPGTFPYCKHSLLVPPKCLGLRLRPFSLGHIDLLTAIEHPVVLEGFLQLGRADVAVAAWICAHDYETAGRLYRSGRAARDLRRLGLKWGWRMSGFEAQRDVLLEYLTTYFMSPPRWDPEKEPQPVIPWHLSVFAALQRDTNYTPAELWDMPLPRALELFAAVAANRGDDSLVSLKEQAIFEQMNRNEGA
jgi:hypothetical protein